jgi:myo-inositol-1(or 4)-monophosphatase
MSDDPRDLLELAQKLAREAGELARSGRVRALGAVGSKSSPTDPVTELDRATESLVRQRLAAERPGDEVLGEEAGSSSGGSGVRWVLDPIDGTVNYLYGLPQYAVSLAVQWKGRTVAGVVRNPESGEEWTAFSGGGAWRGEHRLAGSSVSTLDRALVGTGFGYDSAVRAEQATVVADLLPRVRDIRRLGAASLDLCFAAEGRLDAYYERGLQPWDLAAGALIAEEAGLLVTGLDGQPAGAAMTIAAPPDLHAALHAELSRLGAAGPA